MDADALGFETPLDYARAYPISRKLLTLTIRRMDAVAAVYHLAATMSPAIDGLRSRLEFHRRGRFDATRLRVLRQGLALCRRSLDDRLRAVVEYGWPLRRS